MKIIKLTRRAFDIAVVVEFLQTAKKLLTAFTEQRGDVMRAEETVAAEQAQNFRVTGSECHRRKFFRAVKTWVSKAHSICMDCRISGLVLQTSTPDIC